MNRLIAITLVLVSVMALMLLMALLGLSREVFVTEDSSEVRKDTLNCNGVVTINEQEGVYRMECTE